jgi:hypothetical protein
MGWSGVEGKIRSLKPGTSEVGGCIFRDRGAGGDEGHQAPEFSEM